MTITDETDLKYSEDIYQELFAEKETKRRTGKIGFIKIDEVGNLHCKTFTVHDNTFLEFSRMGHYEYN